MNCVFLLFFSCICVAVSVVSIASLNCYQRVTAKTLSKRPIHRKRTRKGFSLENDFGIHFQETLGPNGSQQEIFILFEAISILFSL